MIDEEKNRLEKLEKIRKMGLNPYPEKFNKTHSNKEALDLAQKSDLKDIEEIKTSPKIEVNLAGRITTFREHGKLTFAQILDSSEKIQIALMQDVLGKDEYKKLDIFDLGDFIGVSGQLFKTHKGEITLLVVKWEFLGKALRPLPEKWHGLKDQEAQYRQRYLDLISNSQTKERFKLRSAFIKTLREFYWQNNFEEVETPVLLHKATGAHATPYKTHNNALDIDVFLRISHELPLKELIVGGFEKIFEIGKAFRNEGQDPSHLPEHTHLEHYCAYWNFEDNIKFTEEMFEYLFKKLNLPKKIKIKDREGKEKEVNFSTPFKRIDYVELLKKDTEIDITKTTEAEELLNLIKEKNIEFEEMNKMGYASLVDNLYKKISRPKLIGPVFLYNYPIQLQPLARRNDKNREMVDQVQLIINGWEVTKAYSELVDPIDQEQRFKEQTNLKEGGDDETMEGDPEYIEAMKYGMPPISGLGMGLDRLITLLTGQDNLRDVILFPLMRPQYSSQTSYVENGEFNINYKDSLKLLKQFVKKENNLMHARETEVIMRALAKKLDKDEELWAATGLLHDLDWEETENTPEKHALKAGQVLKDKNYPEKLVKAIRRHNFEHNNTETPQTDLDFSLRCAESITGLIYAAALVRPDKKLEDVEVKSIKKKMKDKSFAANVNREIIKECEQLGLSLDEFIELSLNAMKEIAPEIGV